MEARPAPPQILTYAIIAQMILFSALLHAPLGGGELYTDIIGFYWRDFARFGRIPYLDTDALGEPFEYPAIAAGLSIFCGLIGRDLIGFYVTYCLLILIFAFLMAYCMIQFSNNWLALLCLAAPSLLVYGIYGYDVIMAALMALAILLYNKGRYAASAIVLAASVHVKLYSVIFLPYVLLAAPKKERTKYLVIFTFATLAPVIALPSAYAELVRFHSQWGIENAWYIIFFPEAATPTGRALYWAPPNVMIAIRAAQLFGYAIMIILYLHVLSHVTHLKLMPEKFMALALMAFFVGTPRYSPQSSILLLPFLPAVMTSQAVPAFIVWELANASIILLWFTTSMPHLPWTPPQTAVLIRFIGLFLMFLQAGAALGMFKIIIPKRLRPLIPFRRWGE